VVYWGAKGLGLASMCSMKGFSIFRQLRSIALLAGGLSLVGAVAGVLAVIGLAMSGLSLNALAQAGTQYVVTNDDAAFPYLSGVSLYTVGANGALTFQQQVQTGGVGIAGGYFGTNRIAVLDTGDEQCVYASDAGSGDIAGIAVSSLTVVGRATGSPTDGGTSNGIGLALGGDYLYASFSDSNTIGTFALRSGCGLAFIGDTAVAGVQGGVINGMAVRGNMLVATYSDGSIESFSVAGGTPLSNGDEQSSTATVTSQGATYANSVDITSDGHYAIFGDTSTALGVEVSDISSGKLAKTKAYKSSASISSSNIRLSPDETLLYVVDTQGAAVSALFFDKTTGKLSPGCRSPRLSGLSANWTYLAGMGLINQTGNGGGVYVSEFGHTSSIATVTLNVSGQKCSLQEAAGSPVSDDNSTGLLSIGTFPPRAF
jgi:lactonase family protein with 7-bladed beta-propeller